MKRKLRLLELFAKFFFVSALLASSSQALGDVGRVQIQRSIAQALEVKPDSSGCLDQRRLEGFVRLWLGRSRVQADIHIVVWPNLQAKRPRIIVEIIEGNKRRERIFDPAPEDCADVHAALGLVIALAIDADALRRFPGVESDLPPKWIVSASLAAGYDVLSGPSVGVRIGVEDEWLTWFSGRLDLLSHCSPSNALGPSAGRYEVLLSAASLQPCMGGRLSKATRLALCSGLGIGALYARGRQFASSSSDTGLWIAVINTLRAEVKLGIIWIIDFDIAAPLYAPTIHVTREDGEDRIQQLDTIGFLLGIGPAYRF